MTAVLDAPTPVLVDRGAAARAITAARRRTARRNRAVSLAIAGVGFGNAYSGNLRTLLPLAGEHERAGLLAAYFISSYMAFAVPAVLAGLAAPMLGLVTTSYYYGAVLIVLILISLLASLERRPARMMEI